MRVKAPSLENGFTLVELIIVVIVLGIISAIAVPYYGDYVSRQRLIGAAEAVYGELQLAKRTAISNNRTIYLNVSGAGGSNWCLGYSESASSACDDGYVTNISNKTEFVKGEDFGGAITLSTSASSIGFVMPGVQVSGAETIALSVTGVGSFNVAASGAMKLSICSSDIGLYSCD